MILRPLICADCGSVLTDEEAHYYAVRCESCEREDTDRVAAWRKGAPDPILDAMFTVVETRH